MSGAGLSPPVRGNPPLLRLQRKCLGSIPACAGEPVGSVQVQVAGGVYPRLCGGTPYPFRRAAAALGSIPACAGEP